jgi:hypothetical protein
MGANTQTEYFLARRDGREEKNLSVFYAPSSEGLSIPREVVRIKSLGIAHRGLWEAITGKLQVTEPVVPTIEPSSAEQVGSAVQDFMRENVGGGLFVDDDTPQEIRDALSGAEEALKTESRSRLADFLGVVVETPTPPVPANEPKTGLYL